MATIFEAGSETSTNLSDDYPLFIPFLKFQLKWPYDFKD
jgi:hypothetical protein